MQASGGSEAGERRRESQRGVSLASTQRVMDRSGTSAGRSDHLQHRQRRGLKGVRELNLRLGLRLRVMGQRPRGERARTEALVPHAPVPP